MNFRIAGTFRSSLAKLTTNEQKAAKTTETSLYEAARYAWKISPAKADWAEVVLALCQGLIVAVFEAVRRLPAAEENFLGREPLPGRYGFVEKEAGDEFRHLYVGKHIPDEYRKQGAANPIKYTCQ